MPDTTTLAELMAEIPQETAQRIAYAYNFDEETFTHSWATLPCEQVATQTETPTSAQRPTRTRQLVCAMCGDEYVETPAGHNRLCDVCYEEVSYEDRQEGQTTTREEYLESRTPRIQNAMFGNHYNPKSKDRFVGIEIEAVGGSYAGLEADMPQIFGICRDGSLVGKNPVEVQTAPIRISETLYVINEGVRRLEQHGYTTNKTCGLHVHVDTPDFVSNGENIMRLINTYLAIEPMLFAMLPQHRRNNKYALPLADWVNSVSSFCLNKNKTKSGRTSITDIKKMWYKTTSDRELRASQNHKYDSSRYHGVNLHSLFCGGHIEFRHHHGTLNPWTIYRWAKLHTDIIDWVAFSYNEAIVSALAQEKHPIKKLHKLAKYIGLDKRTKRYIKKQIYKYN